MDARERAEQIAKADDYWSDRASLCCGRCGQRVRAGMIDISLLIDRIEAAIKEAVSEALDDKSCAEFKIGFGTINSSFRTTVDADGTITMHISDQEKCFGAEE